jgi:hypothetical protein
MTVDVSIRNRRFLSQMYGKDLVKERIKDNRTTSEKPAFIYHILFY